jgi:signal transduction histidine kinase
LSIVQFVVTAHGGTVRVESEPGRGTTFIVVLPIQRRPHPLESKHESEKAVDR